MPISTTLGALAAGEAALRRLIDSRLPVKAAYHVARLTKFAGEHLADFHQQHDGHVRELGVEVDGQITVTQENRAEFDTRMQELASIPVTIPWEPIDIAQLGAVDITPADLIALDALVQHAQP